MFLYTRSYKSLALAIPVCYIYLAGWLAGRLAFWLIFYRYCYSYN